MSFERLEELAKENALEGKHIGCRIHMSATLSGRLLKRYGPELAEQDISRLCEVIFGAPLLYQLMGIPIINDVGMVDDPTLWILVDVTGEEIERGNVYFESEIDPEEKGGQCKHGRYCDEPCAVCD